MLFGLLGFLSKCEEKYVHLYWKNEWTETSIPHIIDTRPPSFTNLYKGLKGSLRHFCFNFLLPSVHGTTGHWAGESQDRTTGGARIDFTKEHLCLALEPEQTSKKNFVQKKMFGFIF